MRSWSTLLSVLFFLFPSAVHASEFYVTSVIRDFPMKNGDTTFKDFYVNAGTNNGLKKGVFLNATRKIAVFDNINSKMSGETEVKIARLQIIHADKGVAIARLVKFFDKEKDAIPLTGFDSVMIGDFIEVSEKQ